MATLVAAGVLSSKLKPSLFEQQNQLFVARLFGPSIFEASKLKVLFLGVDEKKPGNLPRTYTLTHSDVTSKITLAISQTINNSQLQGWYNRLQRDEVVAEWKKVKGNMSLHVHCHISGGHFLLDLFARLRFFIFYKELPVVLMAFVHGDGNLLNSYPELQESMVWVYFHSNIPEFNKMECWGPLKEAVQGIKRTHMEIEDEEANQVGNFEEIPEPCQEDCSCCFPPMSSIPWSKKLPHKSESHDGTPQSL
ncbi:hypothetical protein LWI29_009794 [Acer saccharum]|uniref:Staygreen protein domain-containing protein n=1 Tax=Acer saccharum TaxID=4024 RepID=A0AA39SCY4_ACESA|nr:hypothetical protein LWI29_009794 [Acer saccharum]